MGIFWIFLSYLLGSLPFGYLIARFSGKAIGWRKTSGATNVFKNVGKWQGVLTGILDIAKGYLAVFGAQKLGLSLDIQVFAGVAVVIGHNWSVFLKFGGGRGFAAFLGAFLALSPKIFLFSFAFLFLITVILESSVAAIFFWLTAILLSLYMNQFGSVGVFVLFSLIPLLTKRLSPIAEIIPFSKHLSLIRNRILFDNDRPVELTIKKILKKLKIIK